MSDTSIQASRRRAMIATRARRESFARQQDISRHERCLSRLFSPVDLTEVRGLAPRASPVATATLPPMPPRCRALHTLRAADVSIRAHGLFAGRREFIFDIGPL